MNRQIISRILKAANNMLKSHPDGKIELNQLMRNKPFQRVRAPATAAAERTRECIFPRSAIFAATWHYCESPEVIEQGYAKLKSICLAKKAYADAFVKIIPWAGAFEDIDGSEDTEIVE